MSRSCSSLSKSVASCSDDNHHQPKKESPFVYCDLCKKKVAKKMLERHEKSDSHEEARKEDMRQMAHKMMGGELSEYVVREVDQHDPQLNSSSVFYDSSDDSKDHVYAPRVYTYGEVKEWAEGSQCFSLEDQEKMRLAEQEREQEEEKAREEEESGEPRLPEEKEEEKVFFMPASHPWCEKEEEKKEEKKEKY